MSNVQIMKYLLNRLFKKLKNKLTNTLNVSIILNSFFKMFRQFERKMKKFKEIKSRRFYRNNEISNISNIAINVTRLNNEFRVVLFFIKLIVSFMSSSKLSMFRAIIASFTLNAFVVIDIHFELMNLSSSSKRDSLILKEKKYRRVNNLCNYCNELDHIIIDYHDSIKLNVKKKLTIFIWY